MTRKLVFAASLMIIVVGMLGVASDLHVGYASPYTDVDVDTAYNMITNGSYPDLVVLDVRTQSEYDSGHIYGAVWIPHTELEARISELAGHEDHEIIVYCRSGVRSVNASETLDSFNFTKVYNMLGGILAWESGGYPVWIATVHNLNTAFNYDTIQEAIDAPETSDGHTIFVEQGIYYEHVIVNKTLSLIGEYRNGTIIDGNGTGVAISAVKSNVAIKSFTIRNGSTGIRICLSGVGECCNITIQNSLITNMTGSGIWVFAEGSNKIVGNTISNCWSGIDLSFSCNNTITHNFISKNKKGISSGLLIVTNSSLGSEASEPNRILHNMIVENECGINITNRSNEIIFHNNFVHNIVQAYVLRQFGFNATNIWNNNLEGNYWSDYTGIDSNHDGIGDSWYEITENNTDYYPLMGMFSSFNTSLGYDVNTISNSTIEEIEYFESNSTITMYVSNMTNDQTHGFCRLCIPKVLIAPNHTVTIRSNGESVDVLYFNGTLYDNGTHRWIYFAYEHSTLEIIIVPEFPSFLILPLFMIATLLAVVVYKRKHTM